VTTAQFFGPIVWWVAMHAFDRIGITSNTTFDTADGAPIEGPCFLPSQGESLTGPPF
jgi:hypothetical protein